MNSALRNGRMKHERRRLDGNNSEKYPDPRSRSSKRWVTPSLWWVWLGNS